MIRSAILPCRWNCHRVRSCLECVGDCVLYIGSCCCWAASSKLFINNSNSRWVYLLLIVDRAKGCSWLTMVQHWWMPLLRVHLHLRWSSSRWIWIFNFEWITRMLKSLPKGLYIWSYLLSDEVLDATSWPSWWHLIHVWCNFVFIVQVKAKFESGSFIQRRDKSDFTVELLNNCLANA